LILVNPQDRVTDAMLGTLLVMPPNGAVMSLRQIAHARWPDHPCWQKSALTQRNVLSGLACTTGRLCQRFGLFAVRKHHYVITRLGCELVKMTPGFTRNDHLGDYFEVMVDLLADEPTSARGYVALESLHHWALANDGDLPDIRRAREINRRAIDVLCGIPQIRFRQKGATSAARTIYELCCRCANEQGSAVREANRKLQEPLALCLAHETLSWASRQMLMSALQQLTPREDYAVMKRVHHIDLFRREAKKHFNRSWGRRWQMLQEEA